MGRLQRVFGGGQGLSGSESRTHILQSQNPHPVAKNATRVGHPLFSWSATRRGSDPVKIVG